MAKRGNVRRYRKGHRAKRAYHLSKGVNALQEKHYTFNFTPNDTYINNRLTNPPGSDGNYYTISQGTQTSYNGIPLFNYALTTASPGLSLTRSSASGFASYVDFGLGISYNVNMLENFSAYTGIFDFYRVNYIDLEIEFISNSAPVNGAALLPVIYAIQDRDDSLTVSDQHYLTARQGYKTLRVGNKMKNTMKMRLRPKMGIPLVARQTPEEHSPPLADNMGSLTASTWIDCQPTPAVSQNPPWYFGTKLWFANMSVPSNGVNIQNAVRFTTKWNVSFKGSLGAF